LASSAQFSSSIDFAIDYLGFDRSWPSRIGFIHRVVVIEYDIFIHAFRASEPIFTIVSNIIAYYNGRPL